MLVGSSWKNDGLDNTPHQPQRITSEATQDGNTQGKPDPAKIGAQCQTPFENLRIEPPDAEQTSTTHAESCAAADEGSRGCAACWIRCFCVGPQTRLRPLTVKSHASLATSPRIRVAYSMSTNLSSIWLEFFGANRVPSHRGQETVGNDT